MVVLERRVRILVYDLTRSAHSPSVEDGHGARSAAPTLSWRALAAAHILFASTGYLLTEWKDNLREATLDGRI